MALLNQGLLGGSLRVLPYSSASVRLSIFEEVVWRPYHPAFLDGLV